MNNENLEISCEDLLELKKDHPLEIQVIMEMLAEAGEDYYAEMDQLENPLQTAA